ncbi:hypothetical protein [Achromobacter xylosoxidans]|uniref:hypothetical protein n=1 Tax=Alcaligenes xylosoxydans xylosoxydans TaxID=85698 RepID=UPI0012A8041A|nr:hypothetical protein [Achromobacter xylosoxidans]CUR73931.1 hypothetical protein BN2910_00720 [Achromobacter xylosoxidans]
MKIIGPSFPSELAAAGLWGLPIAWTPDGVNFGDIVNLDGSVTLNPALPAEDRAAVEAVVAAHDPTAPTPAPTPAPVSRYQGREAMRLTPFPKEGRPAWTLFDAFEELLNEPATPAYYRRAWGELQAFEWGSAMLHAAADVLGLTLAQRLDLFGLAATLKA